MMVYEGGGEEICGDTPRSTFEKNSQEGFVFEVCGLCLSSRRVFYIRK